MPGGWKLKLLEMQPQNSLNQEILAPVYDDEKLAVAMSCRLKAPQNPGSLMPPPVGPGKLLTLVK
jgi:hypothetical protein